MVPKALHVGDEHFNVVYILDSLVDKLRLTELFRVLTIVIDATLKLMELSEYTIELDLSLFSTTSILEEFSLPHVTSELRDVLFKLLDEPDIAVSLLGHIWVDLLLGSFVDLLDVDPFLLELVHGLNLVIFSQLLAMEQFQGLLELINLQRDIFGVLLSRFNILLDLEENLDVLEIFVLRVDLLLRG
jgi:hypothetical protein